MPVAFPVQLSGFSQGKARTRQERFARAVAASKETAGQWVVGDHPEPLISAKWQQLAFDLAVEQIVTRLHAIETSQIPSRTDAQGQGHLPGGIVGTANVANLALTNQVIKGPQGFFERSGRVREMRL